MKSVFKFIFVFVICFILCFPVSNVYAYDGDTIDLSPYSSMNMDVYPNSRVSKLYQYLPGIGETFGSSSGSTGFTAEGYMFKNGTPFASPNALYREIIFVNEDDPSPSKAYRQEVISKYNTFLNSNMIASQNGKLRLDYAFYQVNVDYRNISNYAKTSIGRMENGTYRMYMRISDGKQSYLFPLI